MDHSDTYSAWKRILAVLTNPVRQENAHFFGNTPTPNSSGHSWQFPPPGSPTAANGQSKAQGSGTTPMVRI